MGDESSTAGQVNDTSLLDRLAVHPLDGDGFSGFPPRGFAQRVFGGHLLGQAVLSGAHTVSPGRIVNSLHAYFLRPGVAGGELRYAVTRVRDGGSFSVRSVSVTQNGAQLALIGLTFAESRPPVAAVSGAMPVVPPPERLPALHERRARGLPADGINRPPRRDWLTASRPLDIRYVDDPHHRCFWFRSGPAETAGRNEHRAVLAFASDRSLLPVIDLARGELGASGRRVASLDHALWFHADVRAGEWLLYSQDSPASTAGTGLARGLIHDSDGVVVASVAQQGVFS